jgi:hypothetical protein
MRIARLATMAALMGLAAVSTAGAQEQHTVGITMGYPASIGLLWRLNDKVAIRPELSITGSDSGSSGSSFVTDTSSWALGTGVSALFYLHKYDNLRTYVVPRFTYNRNSNTSTSSGFTTAETTTTNTSAGFAGSFGAQYSLGDRFGVFGEVGFGFNHSTAKSSFSGTTLSGNTWGSRTGVGIIFYP